MDALLANVWVRRLLLTFQFMTRIPIPLSLDVNEEDQAWGIAFFPLVGLIVGVGMMLSALLVGLWTGQPFVAAVAAVLAETLLTGGLHVDGFSDCCDGFFSGRGRERMMEIMHDSRMGTFGGAGLFFDLMLKVAMVSAVMTMRGHFGLPILIAVPIVGRLGIALMCFLGEPAREGMGSPYVRGITQQIFAIAGVVGMVFLFALLLLEAVWAALITGGVALLFTRYCTKKLGGLTGDCLGMGNELCELAFLLMVVSQFFGGGYGG